MNFIKKIFNSIFLIFTVLILFLNIIYIYKMDYICALKLIVPIGLLLALCLVLFRKCREISTRVYIIALAGIIVFGVLLRLAAVFLFGGIPISDYDVMYKAGIGVMNGDLSSFEQGTYFHRFPHITFYSVIIGFLFKLFGSNVIVVKIFNVVFKACAIFTASLIGKELGGKKCGLLCAFLFAVFPADIFYCSVTATENFAILFFELSVFFMIRAYKAEYTKTVLGNIISGGAVLAIGSLFRNVAPFYLAAYTVSIFVVFAKRTRLVSVLLLIGSFLIVFQTASFTLYYSGITKYKLSDSAVPYTIYILEGFNFETGGMYSADDHEIYTEAGGDKSLMNKMICERLTERISENYSKIPMLLLNKTKILWSGGDFHSVYWGYRNNGINGDKPYADILNLYCALFFLFILIASVFGIIFGKDKNIICMFGLMVLVFEGGLILMEVQPRYTYAIAYIFIFSASVGMLDMKRNNKLPSRKSCEKER